jgi:hypothetical protein
VLLIEESFFIRTVQDLDEVSSIGRSLDGSIRVQLLREVGFVSDHTVETRTVREQDQDGLTRIEVLFKFLATFSLLHRERRLTLVVTGSLLTSKISSTAKNR